MSAYSDKIEREKQKGLFKVADFDGGKEITLTIEQLLEDMVMFEREMDILTFRDTGKQLQVNVTNGSTLIELFGPEPDDWTGHQITLFLEEYKPGKFGVRIRAAEMKSGNSSLLPSKPKQPKHELDDDIPF